MPTTKNFIFKLITLFLILFAEPFMNGQICRPCVNPPPGCIICGPACTCQLFPLWGRSYLLPRSQGVDAPRDLIGTHRFMHRYNPPTSYYGAASFTPQFMHSYKDDRIAEYFFGTDCLYIAGSNVEGRTSETILADYFGLSPSFESTVQLHPTIANFVGDIGLYGQWKRLYATLHIPIAWTRWKFEMCETISNNGTDESYPARYMSEDQLKAPISSFCRALQGGILFGDAKQGLCYGLVDCPQTEAGVADIRLNIGYDIWLREHGHAGFYLHMAAPTGNRSKARHLFEPVIGNGHHWELGLGFDGRVLIWECDGDQELSLFFDGKISHLFNSRQCRSFDFRCNCFGSRYMLLKVFDNGTYTRQLIPAINITTLPCDIVIDAQFDIVAMVGYLHRGFEFDVGYNAWARTREKVTLCGGIQPNRFGFKGIQNVVTLMEQPSGVTQHTATLHGNEFTNQGDLADDPSPRYINTCDLDPRSAAAHRALTHKLFIYFGHAWRTQKESRIKPFLGIGGSVEFEGNYPDYTQPNKNTVSQYSVWVKCGTGF